MNEQQYIEAQRSLFRTLELGDANTTIVPLRKTYANVAMCLTIVHLLEEKLAITISKDIIRPLRQIAMHHHWYPVHDLHITLKNIRSAKPRRLYTDQEIRQAITAVEQTSRRLQPLDFDIYGPICLPTSIILQAYGTLKHRDAILLLDRELELAGIPDDKSYASNEVFIGNITVCRFTSAPTAALRKTVATYEEKYLGMYRVATIQLIQCDEICSYESRCVHSSVILGN
jgi:hypothetical protein